MYAKKCTTSDLEVALRLVNVKYNDQVIWNQEPTHTKQGIKFTLKVKTNKSVGHGISFSGRQMPTACWHVHGDFFEKLFQVCPNAVVFSLGRRITQHEGNWQDFNVGSQMRPMFASKRCECGN
jgi:hypothetical protein